MYILKNKLPRRIQADRTEVNRYQGYSAGAPFSGYKASGFGRENHKMVCGHYCQSKNTLVNYSQSK